MSSERNRKVQQALRYLTSYLLWLIFLALGLLLFFALRVNLIDLIFWLRLEAWEEFLHHLGLLILGLLLVAVFFWLESYLREGVKRNSLWQRARDVSLVLLGLLVLSYGLQYLAPTYLVPY